MKQSWKTTRGNSTYDTDKYAMHYMVAEGGSFAKAVWPEDTYVGPGAFNSSHIDLIYGNKRNIVQEILSGPDNPYYLRRSTLSKDKATFKP